MSMSVEKNEVSPPLSKLERQNARRSATRPSRSRKTLGLPSTRYDKQCSGPVPGTTGYFAENPAMKAAAVRFAEFGLYKSTIARLLGIDYVVLYRETKLDPNFSRLLNDAAISKRQWIFGKLIEKINQGDTKATIWFLEHVTDAFPDNKAPAKVEITQNFNLVEVVTQFQNIITECVHDPDDRKRIGEKLLAIGPARGGPEDT